MMKLDLDLLTRLEAKGKYLIQFKIFFIDQSRLIFELGRVNS